jgi:phytoene dehydrogenase-like protein
MLVVGLLRSLRWAPVPDQDAAVVGAGPNGLAAAVILARDGLRVTLYERADTIGGGARTAELTLPGFLHDVCSAVHPMALASRFFRSFEIEKRMTFVVPDISYAHPLDGGRAGLAYRDLAQTVEHLGRDGPAWHRLLAPLVDRANELAQVSGTSLARWPQHPFTLAALGVRALSQGGPLWNSRFREDVAPALLTGALAHANRGLPDFTAAAAGLVLATHAHAAGWAVPVGGSQSIVDAMAADFTAHGGTIVTGVEITSLAQLGDVGVKLFDVTPRALARITGTNYAPRFKYGNAVAKVDYALDGPVPWDAAELASAPTIHLGGTRAAIALSERTVAAGGMPSDPYVLVTQPSIVDASRAPAGKHTLWAYTHVPAGSPVDRSEAITSQIERFAPGFRDLILASSSSTALDVESHNPNYIGGDISAGDVSFGQLLARPKLFTPWSTPIKGVYLCSASTAPGPGVHGMGGMNAARLALAREFGIKELPGLGL